MLVEATSTSSVCALLSCTEVSLIIIFWGEPGRRVQATHFHLLHHGLRAGEGARGEAAPPAVAGAGRLREAEGETATGCLCRRAHMHLNVVL